MVNFVEKYTQGQKYVHQVKRKTSETLFYAVNYYYSMNVATFRQSIKTVFPNFQVFSESVNLLGCLRAYISIKMYSFCSVGQITPISESLYNIMYFYSAGKLKEKLHSVTKLSCCQKLYRSLD